MRGLAFGVVALLCAVVAPQGALAGDVNRASCPNEASPGFRSYLPDCRAYELVSPSYKEGLGLGVFGMTESGAQLLADSFGTFADPRNATSLGGVYELSRTVEGWAPASVDTPSELHPRYTIETFSADLASSLWVANSSASPALYSVYRGPPAGPLTLVGPATPPGVQGRVLQFVGASADMSHSVFTDASPNLGEANHLWPGDTTEEGRHTSLYEFSGVERNEPRLVGISDAGVPSTIAASHLISSCGTEFGSAPEGEAYNAISASGETIFFTADACTPPGPPVNELYARIGGAATVAISEPPLSLPGRECSGACETAETVPSNRRAALFLGASSDGSRVFFKTAQPLVNVDTDSGVDVYEAQLHEGHMTRLSLLSGGAEGDPTPGSGAAVLGVARISGDASHVYFVAEGVLTGANGEGNMPHAAQPNLYLRVEECPAAGGGCAHPTLRTVFVATLSPLDAQDWSGVDLRPAQATPDGRLLVFDSRAPLTPDQHGSATATQVFEYDAATETLVRLSRGQDGFNDDGNSSGHPALIPSQAYEFSTPDARYTHLALSADGSRVFFSSETALTPNALEGFVNVYEYHDGQIGLLSDGHDIASLAGQPEVELFGTDESGADAYFTTADALVPEDTNAERDIYDARVDGGPAVILAPAPCSGDACQGAVTPPPLLALPASALVTPEDAHPVASVPATAAAPVHKPAAKKAKKRRRRRHRRLRHRGRSSKRRGA